VAQIRVQRVPVGNRVLGQPDLAEGELQVASLGDGDGVSSGCPGSREEGLHLLGDFKKNCWELKRQWSASFIVFPVWTQSRTSWAL